MGEPSRPTLRQLRDLYLLVGECCELGADPLTWRRRMVEGLRGLLHAEVLLYTESEQVAPVGRSRFLAPRLLVDHGWSCQSDRQVLLDFMRIGELDWEGAWYSPEYILAPRPVLGLHRERLVDDRTWYRGVFFNEWVRRSHNDHVLMSQYRIGNQLNWFTVMGALGGRDFDRRQVRLLRLFAREYVTLFAKRLAPMGGASLCDLAPRVRQVLVCLMEGDSEKQAALRLGISRHTVHDYVKRLHHRFEVSSRGELLSRCRKFWPVLAAEREQISPSRVS
jgi:DNA-binding CsgD family transcriptional regulator